MRKIPVLSVALSFACGRGEECSPTWRALSESLDRVPLSIWGTSPTDIYAVGGGLDVPGLATLVLHYDGASWRALNHGGRTETLWWVAGIPGSRRVWMVGDKGLVLTWDGRTLTRVESGTSTRLYGAWGHGDSDVWIVGGTTIGLREDGHASATEETDLVLHWDGKSLQRDPTVPRRGVALFKVWGTDQGELWVSGESGTLLRRTALGWEDRSHELGTRDSLFTVHGCSAREVLAVGGRTVYGFDGGQWRPLDVGPVFNPVVGVSCGPRALLVVGMGGVKLRKDKATDAWHDEQMQSPTGHDFHGAWADPEGGLWAVGGNWMTPARFLSNRTGAIAHWGCNSR
ncbi:MAG: hypothetical protein HY698_17140 [Deltaproteobacteria bacterium]|nr:hypothetical protein [Deltaproteobacteria bacterium]